MATCVQNSRARRRRRAWRVQPATASASKARQEESMASSGTIRPLYGVIIRDKCKSSDVNTLMAYKTVAEDLLKDHHGPDAADLKEALKDLDKAIAAKKK